MDSFLHITLVALTDESALSKDNSEVNATTVGLLETV